VTYISGKHAFRIAVLTRLDQIIAGLADIKDRQEKDMATIEEALVALEQQVATTDGVVDSVIVLLNGITARLQLLIEELAEQPAEAAELQALVDNLKAKTEALAAAAAAVPPPTIL